MENTIVDGPKIWEKLGKAGMLTDLVRRVNAGPHNHSLLSATIGPLT